VTLDKLFGMRFLKICKCLDVHLDVHWGICYRFSYLTGPENECISTVKMIFKCFSQG